MSVLNPAADALKAMEVMQAGGISILPNDVGYSLIAATPKALHRIFETKRRAPQKLNAMHTIKLCTEFPHAERKSSKPSRTTTTCL